MKVGIISMAGYWNLMAAKVQEDSLEELYEGLNEAMEGYIEVKLENGLKIPVPEKTEKYSGKI